jgi:uncharacterized protein (DUF983 family)
VAERLPSPFEAGFRCVCPRCGEGAVFSGFLSVRSRCESCGLDLTFAQTTEGPAVFIIFIVGFIVMAAAGLTEAAFHLHPMVHLAIWIPVIIILSLALLRPFKATMIALSYRNIVREGGTHV